MIKFFELKRRLFFPQVAGFMRSTKDVPYLYDLLIHERGVSRETMKVAYRVLKDNGHVDTANRVHADWKMLDQTYEHDIALCAQFMLDNKVEPI